MSEENAIVFEKYFWKILRCKKIMMKKALLYDTYHKEVSQLYSPKGVLLLRSYIMLSHSDIVLPTVFRVKKYH